MWRSESILNGPAPASLADVDALNRVFSEAFTERYRRDGLSGVRVPYLSHSIWQFAIEDAGDGAMIWRDSRGELAAFNMVHRSGAEGWMGPLAVRTDRQGRGHGRQVVEAGIHWLREQGVRTIGLETMPRTIENIGFYSRLGFVPTHLTVTLQRDRVRNQGPAGVRIGSLDPAQRDQSIAMCRTLADRIVPGVDFSREIALTLQLQLGDITATYDQAGELAGFALWHNAPLAQGRAREEVRILKLAASSDAAALDVVRAVEVEAATQVLGRIALRCQTAHADFYSRLVADGFRVQWTDLRMTLDRHHEVPRRSGAVLLSNWEI